MIRTSIRVLFGLAVAAIIAGSLLPGVDAPELPASDKWMHFGGYAVLSVLGALSFTSMRRILLVAIACFLLGAALEGAQSRIPGRQASLADAAANLAGVAAGTALPALHLARRRRRGALA